MAFFSHDLISRWLPSSLTAHLFRTANRPLDLKLGKVLQDLNIEAKPDAVDRIPVMEGGPVQRERGFGIHEPAGAWDSLLRVGDDIGVAVGQTLTGTATAVQTISQRRNRPGWEASGRLVATWQPDRLVVGLPLNMDGSEQGLTGRARRFARLLAGRYRLPVDFADERLSTREAARIFEHHGPPAEGRDAAAAKVILEGWMAGAELS